MTISSRLDKDQEKKLEQMKESTGLTTTALIKKYLFGTQENQCINKNILVELCEVSTNVNLMKAAVKDENYSEAATHIEAIEKGVNAIWQIL